jgi:hypothetical protein
VLHQHATEPHPDVWVEHYRDGEAFKAHTQAPYIAQAMSKLRKSLSKPPELIQLSQTCRSNPQASAQVTCARARGVPSGPSLLRRHPDLAPTASRKSQVAR